MGTHTRAGVGRGRRRGFTLVEVAVVVVMLGIVAALAVPTYGAVIDRARGESTELAARAYGADVLKYVAIQRQVDPTATAATYLTAWVDAGKVVPAGNNITIAGVAAPFPADATAADLNGATAGVTALTLTGGVVFAQTISGVSHQVRISASGDDLRFSPATVTSPSALPSAPRSLTATASFTTSAQVAVSWQAPLTGVATDYRVEYATAATGPWRRANEALSTATSTTITNLSAGAPYWVRVAAVNDSGVGPWGTVGPVMAVGSTPPAPSLSCATGNSRLDCTWANPGAPGLVSRYRLYLNGVLTTTTASLTFEFTGLTNYTSYTVGVEAVSLSGTASSRTTVSVAPGLTPPSALTAVPSASGATSQIVLNWSAVTGADRYVVYRATSPTAAPADRAVVDSNVTTTSLTVSSGLAAGTTYYFWVRAAKNSAPTGESSLAGPVSATTVSAPSQPRDVFCDPGTTDVFCAWTAPSTAARPVTSFTAYLYLASNPGSPLQTQTGVTPTSYQFTGLTANTQYFVEVEAVGPGGTSFRGSSPPFLTLS